MYASAQSPPGLVQQRAAVVRSHRARKLRVLLLRHPRNNALRKRYLDYRTPELLHADLQHANRRLALVGAVLSTLVVVLVGIAGGVFAALLLAHQDRLMGTNAIALALGMGSAVCAAPLFALLSAPGWVMYADLIGELEDVRNSPHSGGRAVTAALIEAWGGFLWGLVCGIGIGVLAAVLGSMLGPVGVERSSVVALGMASALALGVLASFAQPLVAYRRGPNAVARDWARLGPLPWLAYTLPFRFARRKYLH
jgi:hypothetical protein